MSRADAVWFRGDLSYDERVIEHLSRTVCSRPVSIRNNVSRRSDVFKFEAISPYKESDLNQGNGGKRKKSEGSASESVSYGWRIDSERQNTNSASPWRSPQCSQRYTAVNKLNNQIRETNEPITYSTKFYASQLSCGAVQNYKEHKRKSSI